MDKISAMNGYKKGALRDEESHFHMPPTYLFKIISYLFDSSLYVLPFFVVYALLHFLKNSNILFCASTTALVSISSHLDSPESSGNVTLGRLP